jgi:hypothetical protein
VRQSIDGSFVLIYNVLLRKIDREFRSLIRESVYLLTQLYLCRKNCYISLPHGSLNMGLVSSISGCILIPADKQGHSLTHSSMSQVRKVLIN